MKALLAFLSAAAILTAAVVASGCALDAVTVFSLAYTSCLAGLFGLDYSRPTDYRSVVAIPTRLTIRRPRTSAGFASVIIFETTCA